MSAPAISAASSLPDARVAPWCTTTFSSGVKRWPPRPPSCRRPPAGRSPAPVPSPAVRARWASTVGVLPRPMSRARQPPSSTASRNPSHAERLGLVRCAARRRSPRVASTGSVETSLRPVEAGRWPSRRPRRVSPPASGEPSSPTAWRRISAPVSWVCVGPLGQGGRRLLEVGPVELDPPAARPHERAGLGRQPGDVGGGQLDVVEHRRPADVAELVGADDGVARRLGEQAQPGDGLRRDSAGTRTSKPGGLERWRR